MIPALTVIESPREPVHDETLSEWRQDIPRNGALVPADYCRVVLAESVDAAPCGLDAGNRLAKMLLGSYPAREVGDPRAYALAIGTMFAKHTEAVGRQAVTDILQRCKFLPTAAEVHQACSAIVASEACRRMMARRHLEEHERRRAEAERSTAIERERQQRMTTPVKRVPSEREAAERAAGRQRPSRHGQEIEVRPRRALPPDRDTETAAKLSRDHGQPIAERFLMARMEGKDFETALAEATHDQNHTAIQPDDQPPCLGEARES